MNKKEYIERAALYIDKQKVKKKLQYIFKTYGVSDVLRNKINKALDVSTVDVVEIRHGEWIYECGETTWGETLFHEHCSLCGWKCHRLESRTPVNYCPNCGAKMKGGAE